MPERLEVLDAARARSLITAVFPDLRVRDISPFGAGWANASWLVNGSLLFRFPKTQPASRDTRKEIALLPVLKDRLPVAVPSFEYAAPAGAKDYPFPFAGYPLLPDAPLSEQSGTVVADDFAASVGRFLSRLHSFPAERASALGVGGGTAAAWREDYLGWYRDTRELVWVHLSQAERGAVATLLERFLETDRHFRFTPVLLHRDLSTDHLLVNAQTGRLTGVIDFGDAFIGDPAFDFTGVLQLGMASLENYDGPKDEGFLERIRFYKRLVPLHELRYGVEASLDLHIENGLAALRRDLEDARQNKPATPAHSKS